MAEQRMTSGRKLFWLYVALAVPCLVVIYVLKMNGGSNNWFWIVGLTATALSLPWTFVLLPYAGEWTFAVAFALNALLLWWNTRPGRIPFVHEKEGAPE
jgi:hypothetical protein